MSDTTIWSVTLELSIMIQEASATLTYEVYSTAVTYYDHQLAIMTFLQYRQGTLTEGEG